MTDAKRDRFARLAPARVDKIREAAVLSNCSNKSNYSWRPNQMQMLFGLLMREFITCAKASTSQLTPQSTASTSALSLINP